METLRYEERDAVAWVTLNRPEVHNAFNATMRAELREVWRGLRTNDAVRVAVLTGAGDQAFCTGIDRGEILGEDFSPAGPFAFEDPGRDIGPKSNGLWKPVVAAVNGMACAGAFYMLGEADIIIAADHATFFDPHVTYGMVSSFESIHMAQRMPLGELIRMQLMGSHERMSAQRAYQIGLVSEVVPGPLLREATERVARAIASQPPGAVQATLRAIWAAVDLPRPQALGLGYSFIQMGSDDRTLREGQEAFRSGRRVEWRLR